MVMKFVLHDGSMIEECGNVFWDEYNKKNIKEKRDKGPSGAYTGCGP